MTRLVLALFFSVSLFSGVIAQKSNIISLQARVDSCKRVKDTMETARAFYAMVKLYDRTGDVKNLGSVLDSSLFYAKLAKNPKAVVSILTYKASFVSDKGDHNFAVAIYREIHGANLRFGDTAKAADMLVNIGMEYNNIGKYNEALHEELNALRLREKIKDFTNIATYYQHIGEVYKQLGDRKKWRAYFVKADSLANADEVYANFFTKMSILNDMGGLYEEESELKKAKAVYEKMYNLCKTEDYANGMAVALSNLVPVLKRMGLKQEALKTSLVALSLSEKLERVYHIITDLNSIGELFLDLGNPSQAIPYFERASKLAQSKSFPLELAQSWKGLYKTFKAKGDYRNALHFHEQEVTLNDSIKGVAVKKTVAELESKYETEKKEQQIKLLTLRDNFNRKVRNRLYFLIVALVLLSGSVLTILYLRRKTIAQQQVLMARQREIAHLNQAKMQLEIDQKNRELSSIALQMASKHEFLFNLKEKLGNHSDNLSIKETVREIDLQIKSSSEWESFRLHFEEVHPNFFKRLKEVNADLTPHEERLCAFLRLNLSSKEIANINNNTIAAVDKSRNRLRKKLELSPEESLKEFLEKI